MKDSIVGLKELRHNMDAYIAAVGKGKSFTVIRKSRAVFKIVPSESEEQWETVADFTTINKNGVSAATVLKELKRLHA